MTNDAPLLLDVTRLIWRRWRGRLPTGIDRVCLAYLRHFGGQAQAVIQHDKLRGILDRPASQALFSLLDDPPPTFRARLLAGFIRNLGRLSCKGNGRLYLNIGHTGLNSSGFRRWATKAGVRPIYLVHDLIPITHPEFCRTGESQKHRERMTTVLTTAAGIIGNSKATLEELTCFAQAERLPDPPALAAWLGIDPLPRPDSTGLQGPATFVVLGTIEGRKNHAMLLDIWSRLIERLGSQAPRLLIIGQRGWEADDVFETLDSDTQLRDHVTELNDCSDQDLANHLASATALLFPSLAEGYGLPLIEALAEGVPVIASDLPVFHEIGRDIPTFVAPLDLDSWEAAILEYARPDSKERSAQLGRMRGYRPPDWNEHFRAVEEWLATLS